MKKIVVFFGSSIGNNGKFIEQVINFGKELVNKNNVNLLWW